MFLKVYKWKRKWMVLIFVIKLLIYKFYIYMLSYFFFINCILCEIEYVNLIKIFILNIIIKYFFI